MNLVSTFRMRASRNAGSCSNRYWNSTARSCTPRPANAWASCWPGSAPDMRRPLRIAWLGHRSATTGDGIITYSRETTEGLRARGADVIFFHHSPELVDAQSYALDGIALAKRLVISPPRAKRMLVDLLQRHEVDVVHVSLSFSSL